VTGAEDRLQLGTTDETAFSPGVVITTNREGSSTSGTHRSSSDVMTQRNIVATRSR
jgi:hypothetical protein